MPKLLKRWNGRGWERGINSVYVAAYSRADAVRVINQAAGWAAVTDHELKVYFSPMWGTPMEGITPERGVWVTRRKDDRHPERLL